MTTSRITWKTSLYGSENGYVNGLRCFVVSYGTTRQEAMYVLHTDLPIKTSPVLGQVHKSDKDAKQAAEALLVAFVEKIGAAFPEPSNPEPEWHYTGGLQMRMEDSSGGD